MRKHDPITTAKTLAQFDFRELASFNTGAFCMYHGAELPSSDWELHPDTDEFLMVLHGSVTVEILTDDSSHRNRLTAGQFVVVPKGHWHRHLDIDNVVELYYTPGETIESTADDPRLG
ncbi:cupin domain-containing protein [Nocardia sp. NPDC023988]|uniref:cupin domain-containing protein n=1 Tax=unclassified Nocardia TaxID=2637762 RepID=UPI0033F2810D